MSATVTIASRYTGYREQINKYNYFGYLFHRNCSNWNNLFVLYCLNIANQLDKLLEKPTWTLSDGNYKFTKLRNGSTVAIGDVIVFEDEENNRLASYGIVESIENNCIQTIEGDTFSQNIGGIVARRKRLISLVIGKYTPKCNQETLNDLLNDYLGKSELIGVGTEHPDINRWRMKLTRKGFLFRNEQPGVFTLEDKEILRQFQRRVGLKPDGLLGFQSMIAAFLIPDNRLT